MATASLVSARNADYRPAVGVPIRSTSDILAALREHPEWKEDLRREILTEDLLGLPAKVAKAELDRKEDQKKVWEAIRETNATLNAFMAATEKRFAEVEKRLDTLEATLRSFMEATQEAFCILTNKLVEMDGTLHIVINKLRELDGGIIEIRSIQKLGNYLYGWIEWNCWTRERSIRLPTLRSKPG